MIIPLLFVWLLELWERKRFGPIKKAATAYWWCMILTGMEEANQWAGLTQCDGWGMGHSLMEYLILLVLSLPAVKGFRSLADQEGAGADVHLRH
ncbi:hypothetical protein [Gorillibacterium sp. sgz5001074]|uniref:hypothetical protein n=1 Tax=Gorillibacterium sp. sgz5001074 TaxID=3446695 RepID=UPI003F67703F